MSDKDEPHAYDNRSGTDWCKVCGQAPGATIHALAGMMRTTDGWAYPYERQDLAQLGDDLVQIGEHVWVRRNKVLSVTEQQYGTGEDKEWRTSVRLPDGHTVFGDGRAATVVAKLAGEDLR